MSVDRGTVTVPRCPEDGVLIAWIDDALDAEEAAVVAEHVDGCSSCANRLQSLRMRATDVGAWLARHDAEAPRPGAYDLGFHRRSGGRSGLGVRTRWGLAAGIVLAVGLAAGPARGWLREHFLRSSSAGGEAVPAAVMDAVTGTSFEPGSDRLVIAFDAGVEGRTLSVAPTPGSRVTLEAPASHAEVVMRPDRLEIHDAAEPPGAYRISVPEAVREVVIRVPGAADIVLTADALEGARTVGVPRGR